MPGNPLKSRVLIIILCAVFGLGIGKLTAQEVPPEAPDVTQSLPPEPPDVDAAALLQSGASCTFPQSIDPGNFQQSNYTLMSLPTSPSDAQIASTAEKIGPISNPTADPVEGSGEFVLNKTHLSFPGFGVNYEFTLHYRSRVNHQSPVGFGWSHNYARHIEYLSPKGDADCAGEVYYVTDKMERITFRPNGTTYDPSVVVYKPTTSAPLALEKHANGPSYYILKDGSGLAYHFKLSRNPGVALLYKVEDTTRNAILINWNDAFKNGDGGIVTSVVDTVGRTFYYNYSNQAGQLILNNVPVDPDARCDWTDLKCLADKIKAQQAARMGTLAILNCISLTKDDCSSPLVSFQQTRPDARAEFDLTSVLDADGNGPSFSYYRQLEIGTYVPDQELTSSCHTICDTQATRADWSCHNLDFCGEKAFQNTLSSVCDGVGDLLKASKGYSCLTYATHACADAGGKCYSQNWYTDRYGSRAFETYSAERCPYDDGTLKTSKALPEPIRNAACDGWLASQLSECNSPLPDVRDFLDMSFFGWSGRAECDQVLKPHADGDIANTEICNQYMADCRAEMEPILREDFKTCPTDCFQKCRSEKGAKDAKGARRYAFGRPQDLNHNLIAVYDGDGRLLVQNTYGVDPFLPSFDRVVLHQETDTIADNKISYEYHELRGEQAMSGVGYAPYLKELGLSPEELFAQILCLATDGCVPYYAVNPDPQHVLPLAQFASVDICPSVCTKWGPSVIPPQYAAEGMVPWNVIDPGKTGYFYNGDPLLLQADGNGLFSVVGARAFHPIRAGEVLFRGALQHGSVVIRAAHGTRQLILEGELKAIDELFGFSDALVLRRGPDGKLVRDTRYATTIRTPRSLAEAAAAVPSTLPPTRLSPDVPTSTRPAPNIRPVSASFANAIVPAAKRPALADELASIAFAQGYATGAGTVVIYRKGRLATIGSVLAPGTTLARLKTTTGASGFLVATSDPAKFSWRGSDQPAVDAAGRVGIVSPRNGELYAVPAGAVTRNSMNSPQSMSMENGIATGVITEGMACQKWDIGPADVAAGEATDVQLPEHAVVVRDLHGIVRTKYYDKEWRLLREVNFTANETLNYNYKYGTLKGMQAASGERSCHQADIFGKPIEVTRLPAPNYPGDAHPHVTRFAYSPNGRLTDEWADPELPTESHTHLQRDLRDRVEWVDTKIDGGTTERTKFGYVPMPKNSPQAAFPHQITKPDGSQTQLTMDPSAGGPAGKVMAVTGDTPRASYAKYDPMGRLLESGRVKHAGSVSKLSYDAAGLPTVRQVADVLNPGSFLSTFTDYDASRQPSHVSDPLLDRYYQYDPYDHLMVEIDIPKDKKTAAKSTCSHFSVDGMLEYAISAEGIVTLNGYDAAGRLIKVDRGYPAVLATWTSACLNGKRAPMFQGRTDAVSLPAALLGAKQTPQQDVRTMLHASQFASSSGIDGNASQAITRAMDPFQVPSPSWPSKPPPNDPGIETVRMIKYAPGGFMLSDTDGSGVGTYILTDGFGHSIDAMDGDPAKSDPAKLFHHWRGYDTQDRLAWEAVVGPNAPAYAKPQAPFPALRSMVEYKYDAMGRRVQTDTWFFANGKPVGNNLAVSTIVTYDDANRQVATAIDQHPAHTQQVDELGRVTSDTLPNGIVSTTAYHEATNGDVRVRTAPGPDGQLIVLTDTYDDRGLLLSIYQGKDELLHQEFDSLGRLASKRTLQLSTNTFAYDGYSRLVSTRQAAAPSPDRINRFGYDRDDRRLTSSTVNVTGTVTTTQTFDGINRLIATRDPLQRLTTYDYYPASMRLHHVTDPQGTVITNTYDFAGRLTNQGMVPGKAQGLDAKAVSRTFSYSPLGGLASATVSSNPPDATNNLQLTMDYDSLGNRINESYNGFFPFDITHSFDPFSRPVATSLIDGKGISQAVIARGFDELHRLTTVSLNQTPVITLGYGGIGGPTSINYGPRAVDPNSLKGATAIIPYDFRGRRTGIEVRNATGSVVSQQELLGLDGVPRVRARRYGPNGAKTFDVFEIDNAARLIKEAIQVDAENFPDQELTNADVEPLLLKGRTHSVYTLDGVANWQEVSTESGSSKVQIDASDEYLQFGNDAIVSNGSGQTTSVANDSYTFDGFGQLTSAKSNGVAVQYAYDALGRRVAETTSSQNQPDAASFVIWDGPEVLATGNSQNKPSVYRLRLGGGSVNSHLALADKLGAEGVTYYVHQATEGSVIALSNDSDLVEGYAYSAFGQTQFLNANGDLAKDDNGQTLTASSVGNRFLYQGQIYDPATALYAMRAREYHPRLGRFLSPDPLGRGGNDNLYAFVAGMPLTLTDPFGLASQLAVDDTMMSSPEFNESNIPLPSSTPMCANCFSSMDNASQGSSVGPPVVGTMMFGWQWDQYQAGQNLGLGPNGELPGRLTPADWYVDPATGEPQESGLMARMYNADRISQFNQQELQRSYELDAERASQPPVSDRLRDFSLTLLCSICTLGDQLGDILYWGLNTPAGQEQFKFVITHGSGMVEMEGMADVGLIEGHHIFPQAFRPEFANAGVNIDQYTMPLSPAEHSFLHSSGWNQLWEGFWAANPGANGEQIGAFGGQMIEDFGLQGRPIVPW